MNTHAPNLDEIPLFTDSSMLHELWEQASKVKGRNPNLWRKDKGGNLIHRNCYMNPASAFGWTAKIYLRTDGVIEIFPVHYKQ
jgi:hypothetical protein